MSKDIEELRKEILNHRSKKGAASAALKAAAELAPVASSRDELKEYKGALKGIIARQEKEILQRRKEIKELRHDTTGAIEAVRWAKEKLGVTESPSGSNWGHPVEDWIKWLGYTDAVPWCGVFAGYAAAKIGGADIPAPIRLGYAGFIGEDARAHANGLIAVPVADAEPGDIFQYGLVHVGLCVGPTRNGMVEAVEGNTSPGDEGSQYNGGCVAHKFRPVSFVTCCARPAY